MARNDKRTPTTPSAAQAAKTPSKAPEEKAPAPLALGADGSAPEGYEFHEGPFPAFMVFVMEDPAVKWTGSAWEKTGATFAILLGQTIRGKPGTEYAEHRFLWNPDGTFGGRWVRPTSKK